MSVFLSRKSGRRPRGFESQTYKHWRGGELWLMTIQKCVSLFVGNIFAVYGEEFSREICYNTPRGEQNEPIKNRKIYRRPAERKRYDTGTTRRKTLRDQQNDFALGERQLYAKH